MCVVALVQPFAPFLRPASPSAAPAHAALAVCDDCAEAQQLGLLEVDLDRVFPVQWKKVADAPPLAARVSRLLPPRSCATEGLAAALDALFYLVGAASDGSLLVQISAGAHRGALATGSVSAQLSYKGNPIPAPLDKAYRSRLKAKR